MLHCRLNYLLEHQHLSAIVNPECSASHSACAKATGEADDVVQVLWLLSSMEGAGMSASKQYGCGGGIVVQ